MVLTIVVLGILAQDYCLFLMAVYLQFCRSMEDQVELVLSLFRLQSTSELRFL